MGRNLRVRKVLLSPAASVFLFPSGSQKSGPAKHNRRRPFISTKFIIPLKGRSGQAYYLHCVGIQPPTPPAPSGAAWRLGRAAGGSGQRPGPALIPH